MNLAAKDGYLNENYCFEFDECLEIGESRIFRFKYLDACENERFPVFVPVNLYNSDGVVFYLVGTMSFEIVINEISHTIRRSRWIEARGSIKVFVSQQYNQEPYLDVLWDDYDLLIKKNKSLRNHSSGEIHLQIVSLKFDAEKSVFVGDQFLKVKPFIYTWKNAEN